MKQIILLAAILLVLAGCTKDSQQQAYTDTPVLEAYLEAGSIPKIKVSHQLPFNSATTYSNETFDTLRMVLSTDSGSTILTRYDTGSYTDSNVLVREGMTYRISFWFQGKEITASTTVPARPVDFTQSATKISIQQITAGSMPTGGFDEPDPIELNWVNTDNTYYIVVVSNLETSPTAIFDTAGRGAPPSGVFRNQPTKDTTLSINSRQFQYFGVHRVLLYHINPDYAALYSNNSSTSQNLTTPATGITNGLGIFTGMSADTLFITVNKK